MKEATLIDYLKGLLNSDESNRVEEWYNQSAENKKQLEDLYYVLFVSERLDAVKDIDVEKSLLECKKKIQQNSSTKKMSWSKRVAAIAAIFIGFILMGSTLTLYWLDRNPQQMTVTTQLGERAKVTLPDGSKVWLNACSNIKYSNSFLSRKREVVLNGEGYFEVATKNRSPFIVSNKSSEIKVLGTKFNMKCNDDESFISASLLEGSILFSEKEVDLEVILKPGEELYFDRSNNNYTVSAIKSRDEIVGWMDGKIIFTNATLEDIAKKLERHYNVKIHFADERIKKERFNADFETPDNIYQIISILAATKKLDYQIVEDKREIIISSVQ